MLIIKLIISWLIAFVGVYCIVSALLIESRGMNAFEILVHIIKNRKKMTAIRQKNQKNVIRRPFSIKSYVAYGVTILIFILFVTSTYVNMNLTKQDEHGFVSQIPIEPSPTAEPIITPNTQVPNETDKSQSENEYLSLSNKYFGDGYYGKATLMYSSPNNRDLNIEHKDKLISAWRYGAANSVSTLPVELSNLSAGPFSAVAILNGGELEIVDNGSQIKQVMGTEWRDIISIAIGGKQSIGLLHDGSYITTEREMSVEAKAKGKWTDFYEEERKDVVQIAAGYDHIVVLFADGTVDARGVNTSGQCNVREWKDIVAIATGDNFTVGLTFDGEVLTTSNYYNKKIEYERKKEPEAWQDICAIDAGGGSPDTLNGKVYDTGHILMLKEDKTALAVGHNSFNECDVRSWRDLKSISAGLWHSVGLTVDGDLLTVGGKTDFIEIHNKISDWKEYNIVKIYAAWGYTVGVDSNGNGHAIGYSTGGVVDAINEWKNIRIMNTFDESNLA